MIAKDFVYYLPETEQEAAQAFTQVKSQGKQPLYYGGGSEIITMASAGSIAPDAVIDLKAISAMNALEKRDDVVIIGGAVPLERIRVSGVFPLLGTTGGRIADHTNQCRITLGGNLCGTVIYRETVLPLLLCDARVAFWSPGGRRTASIHEVFLHGRIARAEDEFVHQVLIDPAMAHMPFAHIKQTTGEKIGYPAVTAASLTVNGTMRFAFSGICHEPFRCGEMEAALNDASLDTAARIDQAVAALPMEPLSDPEASGAYRVQILKKLLEDLERQAHENI